MTWEEAKDQIAKEFGCIDARDFIETEFAYAEQEEFMDRAAKLYARGVADKAYDAGHNRGMYVFEPDGFDLDPPSKEEFMKQLDI